MSGSPQTSILRVAIHFDHDSDVYGYREIKSWQPYVHALLHLFQSDKISSRADSTTLCKTSTYNLEFTGTPALSYLAFPISVSLIGKINMHMIGVFAGLIFVSFVGFAASQQPASCGRPVTPPKNCSQSDRIVGKSLETFSSF